MGGVVWVWGRNRPAVRVAHGRRVLRALRWVRLGAAMSSRVFTAESQTLHVYSPELIASLVSTLQFYPLELVSFRVAVAESSCARLGAGQAESGGARVLFDGAGRCSEGSIPASLRGEPNRFAARAGAENEVGLTSRIFRFRLALRQEVFPFPGGAAIVEISPGAAAAPASQSREPPASAVPRKACLPEGPSQTSRKARERRSATASGVAGRSRGWSRSIGA